MNALYFLFFCFAIAYVIYWALRNDDLSTFNDRKGNSSKKSEDENE